MNWAGILFELHASRRRFKPREAKLQPLRVRTLLYPARLKDRGSVKALEPGAQHRSVGFVEEAPRDMHDAAGVDPQQVAVVGEMMDGAQ